MTFESQKSLPDNSAKLEKNTRPMPAEIEVDVLQTADHEVMEPCQMSSASEGGQGGFGGQTSGGKSAVCLHF